MANKVKAIQRSMLNVERPSNLYFGESGKLKDLLQSRPHFHPPFGWCAAGRFHPRVQLLVIRRMKILNNSRRTRKSRLSVKSVPTAHALSRSLPTYRHALFRQ